MPIAPQDRRSFMALSAMLALAATPMRPALAQQRRLARVITDNDYSGDPDGLFQLAQHILSSAIEIPLIVGSHLPAGSEWVNSETTASDAAAKVREMLGVMGRAEDYTVLAGSEVAIPSLDEWQPSPATEAIIAEAMREDADAPLFYAAGAGLTELALAWLAEPRIGERLKLVWIGGLEHADLAYPPPNADPLEYNYSIDPLAAQVIFNESDIEIWQVPRNAYRQMLFSYAELRELAQSGPIGAYLKGEIDRIDAMIAQLPPSMGFPRTETYILGDSPLVTLTALQSFFQADPSSSLYNLRLTPLMNEGGEYQDNPDGRPMRVYTHIDTRLTFRDMVLKIREADAEPTR